MYDKALARREQMTYTAVSLEEMKKTADEKAWLYQGHVVRRPGLRGKAQGGSRGLLPLYAL